MNARFSDYVTSGAFNLTLTRNQIAELGIVGSGGGRFSNVSAALERKGLVEPVLAGVEENPLHEQDEQWLDHRLTAAGALTLALLHEAGLSNAGANALAREVEALRRQLAEANERAHRAALQTRSMHARLMNAQEEAARLRAAAERLKIPIHVTPRDPLPDATVEDLLNDERISS